MLELIFKKWAPGETLNLAQLTHILEEVGAIKEYVDNPTHPIGKFYSQFVV
jgi:hypothetical protein